MHGFLGFLYCYTFSSILHRMTPGDLKKETMGRIGMLGLCSFSSPYSLGGCGTLHLSLL